MASQDRYMLTIPHHSGLEDLSTVVSAGFLSLPHGVSIPSHTFERRGSSISSHSASLSSPNPSELDGTPSPWRTSLGDAALRNMSPRTSRRSVTEPENIPVTYTPTTHRISKAKKGKKVHVCEFGCGKIFTRAEHRKRHEANHRKEPLFTCSVPDCRKPFQRQDLLHRHLERQHGMAPVTNSPHRGASNNTASGTSAGVGRLPPTGLSQQHFPPSSSAPATGRVSPNASYNAPYPTPAHASAMDHSRASSIPGSSLESAAPSNYMYASSTARGQSEYYPSSTSGTSNYWEASHPASMGYSQSPDTLQSGVEQGSSYSSYPPVDPQLGAGLEKTFPAPNDVDALPATGPTVDPGTAPAGQSHGTGADTRFVGVRELVTVDADAVAHYEERFWQVLAAALPVIHRPSYFAWPPDPFLHDILCAIGAQISTRPGAKRHARILADRAQQKHSQLDPATFTHTATASTMQAVLLFEHFHMYRGTTPGVQASPQFIALYTTLQREYDGMRYDPALEEDHGRWVEIETRNRLLTACYLVDDVRHYLYTQPAVLAYRQHQAPPVPGPCPAHLWMAADAAAWYVAKTQPPAVVTPDRMAAALEHATCLHLNGTISPTTSTDPVAAAIQLATQMPLHAMLITASSSWLFARKVSEHEWRSARATVRDWVMYSQDAPIAAWLASKLLRVFFFPESAASPGAMAKTSTPRPPSERLETDWCLYLCALVLWAFTHPSADAPGPATQHAPPVGGGPGARPMQRAATYTMSTPTSPHPSHGLHRADTLATESPTTTGSPWQRHQQNTLVGSPLPLPPLPLPLPPRRHLQPLVAGPPPPPPTPPRRFLDPLRRFLDSLATEKPSGVEPLRHCGGSECVLDAVYDWLSSVSPAPPAGPQLPPPPLSSPAGGPVGAAATASSGPTALGNGPSPVRSKGPPAQAILPLPSPVARSTPSSPHDTPAAEIGRSRIIEERGALIGEAAGVLAKLRTGRGIWFWS